MDSIKVPKMDVTQLEVLVREDIEKCLQEVTAAVNKAGEGAIINESEEPVREAMARLRQAIYEKAIQMKVDAAEAASCGQSRSGGPGRLDAVPQQASVAL